MGLQSRESLSWRDFGTPTQESHERKTIWMWAPMETCRVYYEGEGGGFPQVRAVVNLVCPCCSWLILAPRVFQLCTNHLVWVMCRPMWVSEAYQLFLVPSRSSNTPFYPSKCCELGSVHQLLTPFLDNICLSLYQNLTFMTKTNMISDYFLVMQSYMPCFFT